MSIPLLKPDSKSLVVGASAVADTCTCAKRSVPESIAAPVSIGVLPTCEELGLNCTWKLPVRAAKLAIAAGCDTIIVVETDPKENLISPEIFAEMGWLEILFRGYGFPVKQLIEKELIRTSRINQNLIGLKLIQRKITKAAGKKQKEIEAVFNENHFYFESRKKIRLIIIQPDKPLLTSGLKWTPNDAVQMIAEGKKIAEAELKKAGLI